MYNKIKKNYKYIGWKQKNPNYTNTYIVPIVIKCILLY